MDLKAMPHRHLQDALTIKCETFFDNILSCLSVFPQTWMSVL